MDVIVCDGFVGNVVLKSAEALAEFILRMLREEIAGSPRGKLGYQLAKPAFDRFRERTDYSEYGAAPLLGLNGGCFIGHGRSNARAIHNAIRRATEFSNARLDRKISDKLAELHSQEERLLGTTSRRPKPDEHRHEEDRVRLSRPGLAEGRHGQGVGRRLAPPPARPSRRPTRPSASRSPGSAGRGPRRS